MYKLLISIAAALVLFAAEAVWASPADDQYSIGVAHYSRGRWKLAAQELDLFVTRYASDPRAAHTRFFLGESLVQLRRYDGAGRQFREYLRRFPEGEHARQSQFRLGEIAFLTGRRDEARRQLERFREQYADDPLGAFVGPYLAEIALDAGDAARAQKLYSEALERYADGPMADESRFGLARALEVQGNFKSAAALYEYLSLKEKTSLADDAQLQLGLMRYNARQYAAAARTLGVFDTTFAESDLGIYARYWLGMTHVARRDWPAAAATFEKAASDAEGHALAPAIALYRGDALVQTGRLDEAQRLYEHVLRTWPKSEWADDAAKGNVHAALKRNDHSMVEELAARFAKDYPESSLHTEVDRMRGRSLFAQENYEQAAKVFQQVVAAEPAPADTENKTASAGRSNRYLLALAQLGAKQYGEALTALHNVTPSENERELAAGVFAVRASALLGLDRPGDAVTPLKAYLQLVPEGQDAAKSRAELAVALAQSNRFDEAKTAFVEFQERHPDHELLLPTTHHMAEAAYEAGDRTWARELFRMLARKGNPLEYVARGLSGLAWSQLDGDDPAASAATFERLLNEHPNSPLAPEAALARGKALEKLGQDKPALAMYHVVIEKYPNSKQLPEALLSAARLHNRSQQNEQAAALYERLLNEHADLQNLDAILYDRAWALDDSGRSAEADAVFTRIHRDHKQSRYWADATYRLGQRAAAAKHYERATQLAGEIIESDAAGPILGHALYLSGQVAARQGRWDDVAEPMRRLIDLQSNTSLQIPAEYWIAEASYRQGDYQQAESQLAELAKKTQGRREAWLGMVLLRQAQILAQEKSWIEAHERAASIAEAFPDFAQHYEVDYLLGRCLASQARFDDARVAYSRVIESPAGRKTETAAMAEWMIGETYFHQKKYEEAIRIYARVEHLYAFERWQAAALLQAGKCHEQLGDLRSASERYAELIEKYPDTMFRDDAESRRNALEQRAAG